MNKIIETALTYDDVLLVPQYSQVLPNQTDISTNLTKDIHLNIPFVSAGMDTVTEKELAIALARLGGLGVIHKSMSNALQAQQVADVKAADVGTDKPAVDKQGRLICAAAVGVTTDPSDRVREPSEAESIDSARYAHGHSAGLSK